MRLRRQQLQGKLSIRLFRLFSVRRNRTIGDYGRPIELDQNPHGVLVGRQVYRELFGVKASYEYAELNLAHRITQKSCRPRVSHRIMVGTLANPSLA